MNGVPIIATASLLATLAVPAAAPRAEAPGAPGISSAWTTGNKQGLGTARGTASKVWHTLGQGILHEVYYPRADVPNVQDLQYVVTDGSTFTELERDATTHSVVLPDPKSLTYQQVNTARSGRYRITKTYAADPKRSTLLIRTRFQVLSGPPLRLYVLYNPSLAGNGMGDTGATAGGRLVASDGSVASALGADAGFRAASSGFSGTPSDGYQQLAAHRRLTDLYDSAGTPGNLVQTAEIALGGTDTTFTLGLGFGANRSEAATVLGASLSEGWGAALAAYQQGWRSYVDGLALPTAVSANGLTQQYRVALMTVAAHEDKTYRGGFVASLTHPWGQAQNADECCGHGYHAVWARDTYQQASALLAAGDRAAANRALDYLLTRQQRPDGSYPQNSWLDGRAIWPGLQLDEVAFPLVLAWQLGRTDVYAKVKTAAGFLAARGPSTPQERWEEAGGYSPSTLAAEIAGLVCAADLARRAGDTASATAWLARADEWQRSIDAWTFTTSGKHSGHPRYHVRIDDNGNPNDGHTLCVANGGGCHDERWIVDAGFLELVRLGVRRADDANITASVAVVDQVIRTSTPSGDMWHRYNWDGYGETGSGAPYTGAGVGRVWPLLSGERGAYVLARRGDALPYLRTMAGSADPGLMLPEQAWDADDAFGFRRGKPTGSANPLAWSAAQFVRLAISISAGRNVETPSVVAARYAS